MNYDRLGSIAREQPRCALDGHGAKVPQVERRHGLDLEPFGEGHDRPHRRGRGGAPGACARSPARASGPRPCPTRSGKHRRPDRPATPPAPLRSRAHRRGSPLPGGSPTEAPIRPRARRRASAAWRDAGRTCRSGRASRRCPRRSPARQPCEQFLRSLAEIAALAGESADAPRTSPDIMPADVLGNRLAHELRRRDSLRTGENFQPPVVARFEIERRLLSGHMADIYGNRRDA